MTYKCGLDWDASWKSTLSGCSLAIHEWEKKTRVTKCWAVIDAEEVQVARIPECHAVPIVAVSILRAKLTSLHQGFHHVVTPMTSRSRN